MSASIVSVSCAISLQRRVHPLGDGAAHARASRTVVGGVCATAGRTRQQRGSWAAVPARSRRTWPADALAGDVAARAGSAGDGGEVDAEQVGERAPGGDGWSTPSLSMRDAPRSRTERRRRRRRRPRDTTRPPGRCRERAQRRRRARRPPGGRWATRTGGRPMLASRCRRGTRPARRLDASGADCGRRRRGRPPVRVGASSPAPAAAPITSPQASVVAGAGPICCSATGAADLDLGLDLVGLDDAARRLPSSTSAPSGTSHSMIVPSSIVRPSLGIVNSVGIGVLLRSRRTALALDRERARPARRRSRSGPSSSTVTVDPIAAPQRRGCARRRRPARPGRATTTGSSVGERARLRTTSTVANEPGSSGSADGAAPGTEVDDDAARRSTDRPGATRPAMLDSPLLDRRGDRGDDAARRRRRVQTARAPTNAPSTRATSTRATSSTSGRRRRSWTSDPLGPAGDRVDRRPRPRPRARRRCRPTWRRTPCGKTLLVPVETGINGASGQPTTTSRHVPSPPNTTTAPASTLATCGGGGDGVAARSPDSGSSITVRPRRRRSSRSTARSAEVVRVVADQDRARARPRRRRRRPAGRCPILAASETCGWRCRPAAGCPCPPAG